MKKCTEEEILAIINKAPTPIKEAIEEGSAALTVADIGLRHTLHVDQIGILAELNRNMLLGLTRPQEFLNELIEARVSEPTAKEIMAEINKEIFIPLRDQMRAAGNTQEQAVQKTSQQPVPKAPPPPPTQPTSRPMPPIRPAPVEGQPPKAVAPQAPRSDLAAAIQKATQSPPPQPQSVVLPPQPMPEPMKEAVRSAPVAPPQSEPPKTRPYSVDPYREPVDES